MTDSDDHELDMPAEESGHIRPRRRFLAFARTAASVAALVALGLLLNTLQVSEIFLVYILALAIYAVHETKIDDLQFELASLKSDHEDLQKLHWEYLKNIHLRLHKLDPQF